MSRVIVKNLPVKVSEQEIRNQFKEFEPITDVQMKYAPDGTFRKFAFVGFASDGSAERAIQKLDRTYIKSSKIVVENCHRLGDKDRFRPWSKHAEGSSAYKRLHGDTDALTDIKKMRLGGERQNKPKYASDPQFAEFLKARGVDSEAVAPKPEQKDAIAILENAITEFKGDRKLTLIVRGLPSSLKANNLKEWFAPVRVQSLKIINGSDEKFAFVGFNRSNEVKRALQRTDQFIGGFRVRIARFPDDGVEKKVAPKKKNEGTEEDISEERQKIIESINDTGRLFLRNLAYICTESDLIAAFQPFGELNEVSCIINRQGACKGFAMITFMFPKDAVKAFEEMDGNIFMGRMLHILPGKEKPEDTENAAENQPGLSEYQRKMNAERRKLANKAHNAWNALFIGADAIAATLAEKLDVEKSDFIAGDDENSGAVRMALAETRLINEVRGFLTENGVVLESFNNPNSVRSKTVMIVKNLPTGVDEKRLQLMFEKCGKVKRFVLPPACKVTAVVEMENQVDAANAFKTLAYKRVGGQPLYLEWAPKDIFNSKAKTINEKTEKGIKKEPVKKEQKVEESEEEEEDDEAEDEEEDDEDMEEEEEKKAEESEESDEDEIDSDDRPFNYDTDEEEEKKKAAKKKAKEEKKPKKEEKKAKKPEPEEEVEEKPLKILVRNIPFQATAKEIRAIFSAFGELTVCRLPLKMDTDQAGKHRGFGFVQFLSNVDAETAFEALGQSTHLYGRRLVLEWANDESKEEMQRAKAQFNAQDHKSKLTKKEFQGVMETVGAPSDDEDVM